ncbi:MAG: PQQ-binding-like beta-propeller repeat protein [bacterium]|nr:PQQ-binding-like beta-propeller repeat protein [bacterium]
MNNQSFSARRLVLGAVLLLALTASACAPVRTGTAWADISIFGDQQNIFVAYNDQLDLVDVSDGERAVLLDAEGNQRRQEGELLRWNLRDSENNLQFFSTPVPLDEDTLLVADYNNRLWRINLEAARIDNPSNVVLPGHIVADVTVEGDTVFVPLSERNLMALNLDDFSTRWMFETERGVWSKPLVLDGVVYFTSMDHHFYAVDAESGEEVWRLDLQGASAAAPLYDAEGDRFFVGSFARRLFEVSRSGEIVSEYETEDWVWNTPVLADGYLYTADLSGYVYALSTFDGGLTEVWKTRATGAGIRPAPAVAEDVVVVAARNGRVVWLERDSGATIFERNVESEVLSDILLIEAGETVTEPLVVVSTVSQSRMLVAFILESGEEFWTFRR